MGESHKSDNDALYRSQSTLLDGFPERVLSALDGRTMKWLSDDTGISTSMLSGYGQGKMPGSEKAVLIADALEVDLTWLLTGRGHPGRPDIPLSGPKMAYREEPSFSPAIVEVDQIDLRYGLGASFSDGHVDIAKRAFDREWLRSITGTPPSKLAWATGDGDSMEPTIRSGEVVLIDTSADSRRFDDTIWAIAIGEVGMIKRLRTRGDTVELLSDNPLVPPQTAVDDEMHAVGRVIAVVRRL